MLVRASHLTNAVLAMVSGIASEGMGRCGPEGRKEAGPYHGARRHTIGEWPPAGVPCGSHGRPVTVSRTAPWACRARWYLAPLGLLVYDCGMLSRLQRIRNRMQVVGIGRVLFGAAVRRGVDPARARTGITISNLAR